VLPARRHDFFGQHMRQEEEAAGVQMVMILEELIRDPSPVVEKLRRVAAAHALDLVLEGALDLGCVETTYRARHRDAHENHADSEIVAARQDVFEGTSSTSVGPVTT